MLINMNVSKQKSPLCLEIPNCKPAGAGTDDYNELRNKPTLNGSIIQGDKESKDYGVYGADNPEAFVYEQTVASDIWTIKHNLNKFPSVTVIDSAGTIVMGEYEYLDKNTVVCTFSGAFTGICYLN